MRTMRAEGLVLSSSPLVFQIQDRLEALVMAARLPSITMFTDFGRAGGCLAYGPDREDMGRRAAGYVAMPRRWIVALDAPNIYFDGVDIIDEGAISSRQRRLAAAHNLRRSAAL